MVFISEYVDTKLMSLINIFEVNMVEKK